MRPRISVVMAVYNDRRFVEAAIRSVLDQTVVDFEFIIVDDGGSDGTLDLVARLAATDRRIRVVEQVHAGLTKALNRGLRLAEGAYVARLDADDVAAPERLEKQISYLEAHTDIAACGTLGWLIDESGKRIGEKNLAISSDEIYRRLLWNNQCIHSSLCFRRDLLEKIGGYDETFERSQDYELILRLAAKYPIGNLSERLISWRVSAASLSWSGKRQEWDAIRARFRAITKYGYPKLLGLACIILRLGWMAVPQVIKRKGLKIRYDIFSCT